MQQVFILYPKGQREHTPGKWKMQRPKSRVGNRTLNVLHPMMKAGGGVGVGLLLCIVTVGVVSSVYNSPIVDLHKKANPENGKNRELTHFSP